jgi:anti-sigma-K factor RskA
MGTGMNDGDHVGDLVSGYVLGTLDDQETLRVARHLPSCALCRQEVDACSRALDELAMAGPEATPPDGLWSRLERRIAAERRSGPAAADVAVARDRRGFLGLFSGRALIAAGLAASILVVAGLTAVAVVLRQQRGVEALRSLEMPVFKLSGTQEMPGATALVVSSSTGDRGTLVVDGLPPLRGSRVYQLWLTRNGASVEGAAFTVDEEGYATVVVHAPRPLTDYTAFSVTMEPGSGSHAPTGPPLLRK